MSEEGSMVAVHKHSDLHLVTLAILMSITVTDKGFTLRVIRGPYGFILDVEDSGLVNLKMFWTD